MKPSEIFKFGIFIFLLIFSFSCAKKYSSEKESLHSSGHKVKFYSERADDWTKLFKRDKGWFGGDGIFIIPYSGNFSKKNDSLLFVFSDTMIGEIVEDSLQPGYEMVHNSLAFLQNDEEIENIEFKIKRHNDRNLSFFTPKDSLNGTYYWLGNGFVNPKRDNFLYLFAYPIRNTHDDSVFPFDQVGNDLLVLKNDSELKVEREVRIPFYNNVGDATNISFGSGVYYDFNHSSNIFVYGTRGVGGASKELIVAKVNVDSLESFGSWEFRKGNGWTKNYVEATSIAKGVANELSVTKIKNGKYGLVYQEGGIYPKIYIRFSDSPYGPFGRKQLVWDTTKDIKDSDLYTYNAKGHPAISKPGELIISYNVNSFKFFDVIEKKPHLYRPRFVRIVFDD